MPFTIPAWIVGHALAILQDRKTNLDAQKANDMENELSPDSRTMLLETQQLPNYEHDDHSQKGHIKDSNVGRKVSMATALGEIKEEASLPKSQSKLSQEEIEEEIVSVQNHLDRLQQALQSIKVGK